MGEVGAAWVAGTVRARAIGRRRLGAVATRELAANPGAAEAVDALARSPYGRYVRTGNSVAEAQHVTMAPHNTNSPIGTVASFHLDASLPNFLIQEYHAEFYESMFFDLVPDQPRRSGPHVPLPQGPGLGITLDEAVARAHPLEVRRGWGERGI